MNCAQDLLAIVPGEPLTIQYNSGSASQLLNYSRSPRLRRLHDANTFANLLLLNSSVDGVTDNNSNKIIKNKVDKNAIKDRKFENYNNNNENENRFCTKNNKLDDYVKRNNDNSTNNVNDVLRHYGDFFNKNDVKIENYNSNCGAQSAKSFSTGSSSCALDADYDAIAICAYNPLCADKKLRCDVSPPSLYTKNICESAYSTRSARSAVAPSAASSLSTPTSPQLPFDKPFERLQRAARFYASEDDDRSDALSYCVTPTSSDSFFPKKTSESSSLDAFDTPEVKLSILSGNRPILIESSPISPLICLPKDVNRPTKPVDSCRHDLNCFVTSNAASLIEMQSAPILEWLREKATLRLAELFHIYAVRKSAASPSKRKLISRFDVDLIKSVKNVVKGAKWRALNENAVISKSVEVLPPARNGLYNTPLAAISARTSDGAPLPRFTRDIMAFIERSAANMEGIFRKNGVKGRIQEIRDRCNSLDANEPLPEELCADSQLHNLADAFKLYLRELPECLMTKRLSAMVESSIQDLPESKRLLALHYCVLLLPTENREALMLILGFLHRISEHSAQNQMSIENLATCLMPSLFYLPTATNGPMTKRCRHKTIGTPSERERNAYNALKEALTRMIREHERLLGVPSDLCGELRTIRSQCELSALPLPLKNGTFDLRSDFLRKLRHRIERLKSSHLSGWKGWKVTRVFADGTRLYERDLQKGLLVPSEFMVQSAINTSTSRLHALLIHEKNHWDQSVEKCQRVGSAGQDFDVIEVTYEGLSMKKRVYLARKWTYGSVSVKGAQSSCGISALVERAVVPVGVRDLDPRVLLYKSDFLVVPDEVDQRRCHLIYVSRVDLRGKTLEWYNTVYGNMIAERIRRLRLHIAISSPFQYHIRQNHEQTHFNSKRVETIV